MGGAPRTPDLQALLSNGSWAYALARSLVGDEQLAEDIVQTAALATLGGAPPQGLAFRSWFAAVIRNLARMAHRTRVRRDRREDAARRADIVPSTAELAERADQHRRLTSLVLELEEPYRSTILLRFFGELTPMQIGEHLGEPPATIRSRLARGLDRLRERLERDRGAAWKATLGPLVTLMGPRGTAGHTLTGGAAGAAGTKAALTGLVLLILGGVALWHLRNPTIETTSGPPGARPAGEEDSRVGEVAADPTSAGGRIAAVPLVPDPDPTSLSGRVVDPDGKPVPGARVVMYGSDTRTLVTARTVDDPKGRVRVCVTDAQGRFRLQPGQASPSLYVFAEAQGFGPVVGETHHLGDDVTVTLGRPATIRGTVRDAEGHAIGGALVRWQCVLSGVIVERDGRSAPDGSYVVTDIIDDDLRVMVWEPPFDGVEVRAEGFATTTLRSPFPSPTREVQLPITLGRGATVRGRVVDGETGKPIPSAHVACWSETVRFGHAGTRHNWIQDALPIRGLIETDAGNDGTFVLSGISCDDTFSSIRPRGPVGSGAPALAASAPGYSTELRLPELAGNESTATLDIQLFRCARIEGRVLEADGSPARFARVSRSDGIDRNSQLPPAFAENHGRVTSDRDGRYVFDGVRVGSADSVDVAVGGFSSGLMAGVQSTVTVAVRRGTTTQAPDIRLFPVMPVPVRVVDEQGRPIAGATVSFNRFILAGAVADSLTHTGMDGCARLGYAYGWPDRTPSPATIYADAPGFALGESEPIMTDEEPQAEVVVKLARAHAVFGRVVDEDGALVPDARVLVVDGRLPEASAFDAVWERGGDHSNPPPQYWGIGTAPDGRFRIGGLPPGPYYVGARPVDGFRWGAADVRGVQTDGGEVTITVPRPRAAPSLGALQLVITDADSGRPVSNAFVAVAGDGDGVEPTSRSLGVYHLADLTAGTYTVRIQIAGYTPPPPMSIEVLAGKVVTRRILARRGVTLHGTVTVDTAVPFHSAVVAFYEVGVSVGEYVRLSSDGTFVMAGLGAGKRYRVCVLDVNGRERIPYATPIGKPLATPAAGGDVEATIPVVTAGVLLINLSPGPAAATHGGRGPSTLEVVDPTGERIWAITSLIKPQYSIPLPPGNYSVTLKKPDTAPETKQAILTANAETSITFGWP